TLQHAWFRAAKEIQPHTNGEAAPNGRNVYVTVMWAHKAGADPINDHLWGEGSVSADPLAPNSRTLMWAQPCPEPALVRIVRRGRVARSGPASFHVTSGRDGR